MSTAMNNRVYAVLPACNETGKIGLVVEKIKSVHLIEEIVVVDDCSTDGTSDEARKAGATVVRHEVNRGVGAGIRSGIQYGLDNNFGICVILSGDDQHEPREIPRVVQPIIDGDYEFIQGSRRITGGRVENDRIFRKFTTQMYSLLFSMLTLTRITDATNGFRAFRLGIFDEPGIDINQDWLDRYELEPYILFKAVNNKRIRLKEVPITIHYHIDGRKFTKMKPFRDWYRLAKPMVYLGLGLRK